MSGSRDDLFQHALDEAWRNDRAANDETAPPRRPRVGVGIPFGSPPGSGGKARFGLALDWTNELADRLAPPPQPLPREAAGRSGDTPADIAAELGLGVGLTLDQLASRWRDFVWRNHPDRQPLEAWERANARVAVANALYERARRRLAKARPDLTQL